MLPVVRQTMDHTHTHSPTAALVDSDRHCCACFVRVLLCSNFKMYAPITECLCYPDDGGDAFGVRDKRFPQQCSKDPHSSQCDGHTFVMETPRVKALSTSTSEWANGIDVGEPKIWSHAFCKTCKTECAGTAANKTCTACPECVADANGESTSASLLALALRLQMPQSIC